MFFDSDDVRKFLEPIGHVRLPRPNDETRGRQPTIESSDRNSLLEGEGLYLPSLNGSIWSQTIGRSVVRVHSLMEKWELTPWIARVEAEQLNPSPWGWYLDIELDTGLMLGFRYDKSVQSLVVTILKRANEVIEAGSALADYQEYYRKCYIPWD